MANRIDQHFQQPISNEDRASGPRNEEVTGDQGGELVAPDTGRTVADTSAEEKVTPAAIREEQVEGGKQRMRRLNTFKIEASRKESDSGDEGRGEKIKGRNKQRKHNRRNEGSKKSGSKSELDEPGNSDEKHVPNRGNILSTPIQWDPEGSKNHHPQRRYFETEDGSGSRSKRTRDAKGADGDGERPPVAPSNGFWQKTGRKLNKVFPVIHPLSNIMAMENLIFGVLVLYSVFSATYQIGYDQIPKGAWLYFETSVDFCYFLDCAFQFRVGYFSGTMLPASSQQRMIELGGAIPNTILDGRKIAWHYLTHWFIIDFISSFPFDIVFNFVAPTRPWSLQFLMLTKLLRLPRFFRARSQLRRFLSQAVDELVSLFTTILGIFFYCHVSGCVFWYIVKHETTPNNFGELNMWDDNGVEQPLTVAPPQIAYLAVLYFLVVSFASVGYGDLHPSSATGERIWAIFNGAFAAIALGYVVGKITSLVFTRSERRMALRERFDVLHRVVERERLPEMLAVRMTQQLATVWESKVYRYNEEELYNELPAHLRAEFLATWWIRHIRPSALFPHYFPFLRGVLSTSGRQLSPPGDYVVREGQISRSIYVLWKGRLAISSSQAVESRESNADIANDPHGDWKAEESPSSGSKRSQRTSSNRQWTKDKAHQIKDWFGKIKHRGDDFSDPSNSGVSDVSDTEEWDEPDSDSDVPDSQIDKKHMWEVGEGTIIGERALMNQLARRMEEKRRPDWERIRVTSITMDVSAKSIDESYLLRILLDDLIIDDFPPLLDDLMEALKQYTVTPPGVRNRDS